MIISFQLPSEYFLHTTLLAIILLHMVAMSYFNFTGFDTGLDNEQLEPLLAYYEEVQAADHSLKARIDNFTQHRFKRQQRNDQLVHGVFVLIQSVMEIFTEEDFKENGTFSPEAVQRAGKCSEKNAFAEPDLLRARRAVAEIVDYQRQGLYIQFFGTKQADMDAVFEYNILDPHDAGATEQRILSALSTVASEQRALWLRSVQGFVFETAGAAGHTDTWKNTRSIRLAAELHVHLGALLNTKGCEKSPQVICQFRSGKFSTDVHKVTYCLAVAYVTRRTLRIKRLWGLASCARRKIGDYVSWKQLLSGDLWQQMPGYAGVLELSRGGFDILVNADEGHPSSLPAFFANVIQPSFEERIREFHDEPEVWLVGQMADFILKPLKSKVDLNKAREEMAFGHPIVGLYLHGTDNTSQSLASLMEHVTSLKHEGQSFKTRVFVVTLNPDLFKMLQENFPEYTFLQRKRSDKKDVVTQELYLDVYFLSRCDYLVCSFKWHMCRLAYELMQTPPGDFSGRPLDLSQEWFFDGFRRP